MSTIKASNIQNGSSSSVNIALNTDGSATFAQVPGTPYSFLRNRIINGAMVIDQRNAGAAVNGSGGTQTWPVDRFYSQLYNTTGNTTGQQSSIAPSGFTNSMRITVQTADTSVGASDQVWYGQNIEGFNTADFAFGTASALPITLSFWVYGNVTGTYCVAFKNSAENRTYVAEYSITVADTWQRKTITLPGDITGAWLTNNGTGLKVWFVLMAGSSVQTTANAWSSAAAIATSNQVNFMSSTANYWQITGVQLETGSVATPFERRLINQELAMCQRYYIQNASVNGIWINNTQFRQIYQMPVTMRTNPTVTIIEPNAYHEWWNLAAYTGVSGISTVAAIRSVDFTLTSSSNRGRSYGDPSLIGSNSVGISAEL